LKGISFLMKTWVRKTLSVGVLAAGALLFAPAAAQADVHQSNGDNVGILNGTQIAVPVRVPVNVVGNSLGILGVADSRAVGVNNLTESTRRGDVQSNGDNVGILNGTQAYLPVSVPVNVVGNAAAVGGVANTRAVGVNGRQVESGKTTQHRRHDRDGDIQSNGDNVGIGNGTQIYAPIDVPINVCGNSIAVLGGAFSQAVCSNDLSRGSRRESGWQSNGDNVGIANGTQLYAPISLPVNLSGNSVGVLGAASSRAVSVNKTESSHPDVVQSNGDNVGILNGTQVAVPINIPINACGNALGILGAAQATAACVNDLSDDRDRDRGGFWGGGDNDGDWDGDWDGHGHGKPGHHHGDDDDDFGGAKGDDDKYKGDHGNKDDDKDDTRGNANAGYNAADEEPADEEPAAEEPAAAGYGGQKPATGSPTKSNGGRDKAMTEGSPVTELTSSVTDVTGLGLLNTLR
jgi:hypothetical protein